MSIAITKMAKNGQIVIPSEIRKDAKIKNDSKFLVYYDGDIISLKKADKEFIEELELIKKIKKAEKEIKEGKFVEIDSNKSEKEILELLEK